MHPFSPVPNPHRVNVGVSYHVQSSWWVVITLHLTALLVGDGSHHGCQLPANPLETRPPSDRYFSLLDQLDATAGLPRHWHTGPMRGLKRCSLLLTVSGVLAGCGTGAATRPAGCQSGMVSVTVAEKPAVVCVMVGTSLVMHGGGTNVEGYWPGQPTPSNRHILQLASYSTSAGFTATAVGGESPSGSQPSASTVLPGTMTAHFKALKPGTAKVAVHYFGNGRGYPLVLTVRVIPKG